jgi:hypothetical protein
MIVGKKVVVFGEMLVDKSSYVECMGSVIPLDQRIAGLEVEYVSREKK